MLNFDVILSNIIANIVITNIKQILIILLLGFNYFPVLSQVQEELISNHISEYFDIDKLSSIPVVIVNKDYVLFQGGTGYANNSEDISISASMVSAAADIIWSHHPELSEQEIKNCILNSVTEYEKLKVILPGSTNYKVNFSSFLKTGGSLSIYKAFLIAQQYKKENINI